jgi:hypothetical protein
MGLDISAYRGLKKLDVVFDGDGEPIDPTTYEPIAGDWIKVFINPHFPGRANPLENDAVYSYEEAYGGPSMGYGWYNRWRNELAKLAGYEKADGDEDETTSHCIACWNGKEGPFAELINFSDCEGIIGSIVSSKLAKNFASFQEKADQHPDLSFRKCYGEFRRAFEFAADNGAVDFH